MLRRAPAKVAHRVTGRKSARRIDPFTAGRLSFERGEPLDADFGSGCAGWPPISAQCLYEMGRLKSAAIAARVTPRAARPSRKRALTSSRPNS